MKLLQLLKSYFSVNLEKGDIILIYRFIIVFWVTTRTGLHALILKNTSVFSFCPVLQLCISCFSSCLFKALHPEITQYALIGQPTHTWASSAHRVSRWLSRVFNCLISDPLPCVLALIIQMRCSTMSRGHGTEGGTTDEEFQEQCFSVGQRSFCWCGLWAFYLLRSFTCTRAFIKLKERKITKSIIALLK